MTARILFHQFASRIRSVNVRRAAIVAPLVLSTGFQFDEPQVGICGRTPVVIETILGVISTVDDCAAVTPDHLADISHVMDLSGRGISVLQVGDFQGLENLIGLDLRRNELQSVPIGVFSGLQQLDTLYLDDNPLVEVPIQALDDLPNLRILGLSNNDLTIGSLVFPADSRHSPEPGLTPSIDFVSTLDQSDTPVDLRTVRIEDGSISDISVALPISVWAHVVEDGPDLLGSHPIEVARISRLDEGLDPRMFGGFGIVAFVEGPIGQEARYRSICEGYFNVFVSALLLRADGIPFAQQFVTYWPTQQDGTLVSYDTGLFADADRFCKDHVEKLDLRVSRDFLKRAESHVGGRIVGRGPFLLAWSRPVDTWEAERAVVLVLDLSRIESTTQANQAFRWWKDQIQTDPESWENGWDIRLIRMKLAFLADSLGRLLVGFWRNVQPLS